MRLPGTDRQEVPHSASISHEYGQSRATRRHYIQTPSGYHARGGHAPDAGPLKPARWPSRTVTSAEAARWAKSNRSLRRVGERRLHRRGILQRESAGLAVEAQLLRR